MRDAGIWVDEFLPCYNGIHRHSCIGYVTRTERHEGLDVEILEHRKCVYPVRKLSILSAGQKLIRTNKDTQSKRTNKDTQSNSLSKSAD